MKRKLTVYSESWAIRGTFRISRGSITAARVVVAEIEQDGCIGRGESAPSDHYGQNVAGVTAQILGLEDRIAAGMDRIEMQSVLQAGSARNALDCALWDLAAKLAGQPAWQLAGLKACLPLQTAFTISLDAPEKMQQKARKNAHRPLLKLKLTGKGDVERVAAVRSGAPGTRLIVDANESWDPALFETMAPQLKHLGVEMIEQPFPAGEDAALADLAHPVPVCADESCHDSAGLKALKDRYDVVNIKLEKTGGLTEALRVRQTARKMGFKIMVGCMVATSLAIAPAVLAAQGAEFVDLDGALLLEKDRYHSLDYKDHRLYPPQPELWG